MTEKQPIEPEKRDNPAEPLNTDELRQQLGEYAAKLTEQGQQAPKPPGAQGDVSSSETQER